MKKLILGGARSGKSRYAEQQLETIAQQHGQQLIYVATATAGDREMARRIQYHQQRRASQWQLVEEPVELASRLQTYNDKRYGILIDCLTLWLSNALIRDDWAELKASFIKAVDESEATIFLVSNEVGSGIVPLGELSRQFVDESGWLHQELATLCQQVTLVVAGLPLVIKSTR
ncbi:MAG: bifunctional adenosylcobinamide kinase/adenosylcobinamide-phosphate guanylyltransferase [Pseudomonadota bacterium]